MQRENKRKGGPLSCLVFVRSNDCCFPQSYRFILVVKLVRDVTLRQRCSIQPPDLGSIGIHGRYVITVMRWMQNQGTELNIFRLFMLSLLLALSRQMRQINKLRSQKQCSRVRNEFTWRRPIAALIGVCEMLWLQELLATVPWQRFLPLPFPWLLLHLFPFAILFQIPKLLHWTKPSCAPP